MGSCLIKPGILRLQPWTPNFNPFKQKTTNTQVWVRFYDLAWVYWDTQILFEIAFVIGTPLKTDKNTEEGNSVHYVWVLIDADLAKDLEYIVLVERAGSSIFSTVEY